MPGKPILSVGDPRRLLVRGVNWLGDAVMTTPALQRLRERFPESNIALLTHEKLADLWARHPSVNEVLTFARGDQPWSVARRLRSHGFDAALVLPNSTRSALEVWLAGIPHRIGYAQGWRNSLLTRVVGYSAERVGPHKRSVREVRRLIRPAADPGSRADPVYQTHQMMEYLHLAAALGSNPAPLPPKAVVTVEDLRAADATFLAGLRVTTDPGGEKAPVLLGLNPSAAYGPAKRWPIDRFAEVAREVSERIDNCHWLAFGAPGGWNLCEEIVKSAGSRATNLAGKTSLRQLMALLKRCRVLLTNDSGPMHLAAALGTRVVVPFGSTSPELTGPGLPGDPRHRLLRSHAPCSPCFRRACPIDFRCMTGITTAQVITAILELLKTEPSPGA